MPCFQCEHIPQGQEGRVIEKENLLDHLKCCISMLLRCKERKMVERRVYSVNTCNTSLHSPCHAGVTNRCALHISG